MIINLSLQLSAHVLQIDLQLVKVSTIAFSKVQSITLKHNLQSIQSTWTSSILDFGLIVFDHI